MGSISIPVYEFLYTYGATIVAGAATVASSGVSAYAAHEQGVAIDNTNKQKARAEQISETQNQINMRENMLKALAAQNAGTLGAVGTGANTGFGTNARRQITQAQNDIMVSKANSSAQVSLLDQEGASAVAAGNIQAGGDIFAGAARVAGAG